MTDDFNPERAIATVKAFIDAFLDRDLDRMADFWTDDFIQWHSHIRKDFDKAAEIKLLEGALTSVFVEFYDKTYTPTSDGVLMQHTGNLRLADGTERRGVPFAALYHFRGDKIARCEEYLDGLSMPPINMSS